jgi:hypothetical protein
MDGMEGTDGEHGLSWSPWTDGVDGCGVFRTPGASLAVVNHRAPRHHWTHRASFDDDGDDRVHGQNGTDRLDGTNGLDGADRLDRSNGR